MKHYLTFGVSFPDPKLLKDGKARAARLDLSFSDYICRLVREELERGGDFVLREGPPPADAPAESKGPVSYGTDLRQKKKARP
jgi:hypothetical protein